MTSSRQGNDSGTGLRAGFLPLYLDLYDDFNAKLRDDFAGFIKTVMDHIRGLGVEIVPAGIITKPEDIKKAAGEFTAREVDLVITLHLSYSPSLLVADTLAALGLPILVLDTTMGPEFDQEDKTYLMMNHGIHGVMDLTSVLMAKGVSYYVVAGHVSDPGFTDRARAFLEGIRMARALKNQTIGITGSPFAGMGDFAVDFDEIGRDLGTKVHELDVSAIAGAAKDLSESRVAELVEKDREELDLSKVSAEAHEASVRTYLAIRDIGEKAGLSGYTMNFQHIGEEMAVPFYACTRLMSEGIGYGGEGDVLTATLGRPLNASGRRAMFNEMFCADWKNGSILMSHMGETDLRFCKRGEKPRGETRPAMGNPHESMVFHFPKEPMKVTIYTIASDADTKYRLITFPAEIIDSPVYPNIQGPHFMLKPPLPVAEFLERYAECGGGHHLYVAEGDLLREAKVMAQTLGWSYNEAT